MAKAQNNTVKNREKDPQGEGSQDAFRAGRALTAAACREVIITVWPWPAVGLTVWIVCWTTVVVCCGGGRVSANSQRRQVGKRSDPRMISRIGGYTRHVFRGDYHDR